MCVKQILRIHNLYMRSKRAYIVITSYINIPRNFQFIYVSFISVVRISQSPRSVIHVRAALNVNNAILIIPIQCIPRIYLVFT